MSGFPLTLKAEKLDVLCVGLSVFLSSKLSLIHSLSRFIINANVVEQSFLLQNKILNVGQFSGLFYLQSQSIEVFLDKSLNITNITNISNTKTLFQQNITKMG